MNHVDIPCSVEVRKNLVAFLFLSSGLELDWLDYGVNNDQLHIWSNLVIDRFIGGSIEITFLCLSQIALFISEMMFLSKNNMGCSGSAWWPATFLCIWK